MDHLVYVGDRERRVFSRALDALESVPISSPSNPQQPTISPDGQSFGYLAPAFTWRRQTFNGVQRPSVTLQVGGFRGVAWEADGSVIAATHGGDLLRLDEGGKTSTLAKANPAGGEVGLFWPCLTPTRGKILVTVVTNAPSDPYSIASLDVSAGTRTTLLRGTYPQLVKTGHLLFANDGAIWAVQFDAQRAQVVGSPVRVLESVATTLYGAAEMTVSDEGTVVYARGGSIGARTLAWVDRDGREEPLQMPPRPYIYPRISPDGGSVAVTVRDAARDIWIWDLKTTTLRRLTNTPDLEDFPLWSPDGATVMYSGTFKGVFAKSAAGSGDARRIAPPFPAMSISPDGSRMVGGGIGFGTSLIIIGGDTPTMRDILKDENPMNPRISPDGKWLAYQSRQSGQYEIYVRPFPDVDRERRQVSVQGGTRPVWARNMREIFYLSPAGAMMSVAVAPDAQFTSKEPVKLFQIRHRIGGASEPFTMYDVAPDGRRFLVIKDGELESLAEPRLTVIQNWFEELQRLVPAVRR